MPANTPLVFISSTKDDLEQYRSAAKEAAIQAGFHPIMMDYFTVQSGLPPYSACMAAVDSCDVLVVIVAHRYGWLPPDQPGPEEQRDKSITWLECEYALNKKQRAEVLAFVVDEKSNWPPKLGEAYRSTKAIEEGADTPALIADVKRAVARLKDFKEWLRNLGTHRSFSNPDDLNAKILAALYEWRNRHPEYQTIQPPPKSNPEGYLRWLREQTAWIDIRGLQVGTGKAYRFPIDDLYIPLKTVGKGGGQQPGGDKRIPDLLEQALHRRRLVIIGDPGSGKTTFLRRMAYELCRRVEKADLQLPRRQLPILIRIAELEEHIKNCRGQQRTGAPTTKESPKWLAHFLEARSQELEWNLDVNFFEQELRSKSAVVLLDGLDETVNRMHREAMARLVENVTDAYSDCNFVVTTRPGSYQGLSTLGRFHEVYIEDLDAEGIERFLNRWSQSLYPENPGEAEHHCGQLLDALHARFEIRRMARNPVMLTALAVVHWNEKRLPEQRADLYESIVTWLARSREQRPGRVRSERCLALLGHLALGMQDQKSGRLTQISKGQAAQIIETQFREIAKEERFNRAQIFLEEEEVDSGIVVSRGNEVRFWHLTFQEFLSARAISGLADAAQQKVLLLDGKLYRQEWREVLLLLAGILLVKQGPEKVDGLFEAVLDRMGTNASLAVKAQCVGLLGAVLRDLQPLAYEPCDPHYRRTLDAVLEIFEENKASSIDLLVRLEAAEALGQAGDPRLGTDKQAENWITIPAGSFLMGAQNRSSREPNFDDAMQTNEWPVHEVTLESYQIGRYPVTVGEYRRFVEDDGYENEAWWQNGEHGTWTQPGEWEAQLLHPNRPVVNVSWFEAAAWCAWTTGRLPTEAQWERAARGASGSKYPWGDQATDTDRTGCGRAEIVGPTPVGLFPRGRTPEGVYDLAGNVGEWVWDWYGDSYYNRSPKQEPLGAAQGAARVVRGGRSERSARRDGYVPYLRDRDIGFRCVRQVRRPRGPSRKTSGL